MNIVRFQCIKTELLKKVNVPYVIYGNSGCGKTSLMAKLASEMQGYLKLPPGLIMR